MIIFQESGRLGNQIFQYVALRSLCNENEMLLLYGFDLLKLAFDGLDAKIINADTSELEKKFYYKLYPRLEWLARKGLIGKISEQDSLDGYKLIKNEGLIKSIKFIECAYFQSESLFRLDAIEKLRLKPKLLEEAKKFLSQIDTHKTFFVHIRRGDYVYWPSKENPAILPASYYRKCIDLICAKISNPFFIFTSDDPFYVVDIFSDLDNCYISRKSSIEDFAIMTQCHGGILSASSFSWWAAYFAHLSYPDGLFFAPEYWAGHSIHSWFPANIKSSFPIYV